MKIKPTGRIELWHSEWDDFKPTLRFKSVPEMMKHPELKGEKTWKIYWNLRKMKERKETVMKMRNGWCIAVIDD